MMVRVAASIGTTISYVPASVEFHCGVQFMLGQENPRMLLQDAHPLHGAIRLLVCLLLGTHLRISIHIICSMFDSFLCLFHIVAMHIASVWLATDQF